MNDSDRQAIAGLFAKLGEVERQAPPRDAGAEAFIREQIGQQPGAPYFMAQTIVMQEYALNQAQARIQELEAQEQPEPARGGGLLGGLFGGGAQPARRSPVPSLPRGGNGMGTPAPGMGAAPGMPPQGVPGRGGFGGGGFLAGAAQTAMGVAGGMLLGSAISGMFSGGEAQAATPAEPGADASSAEAADTSGADTGGGEDEGMGGMFDGFFGGGGDEF